MITFFLGTFIIELEILNPNLGLLIYLPGSIAVPKKIAEAMIAEPAIPRIEAPTIRLSFFFYETEY